MAANGDVSLPQATASSGPLPLPTTPVNPNYSVSAGTPNGNAGSTSISSAASASLPQSAFRQLLRDRLNNASYQSHANTLVRRMQGRDLTVSFLQREGFENPIIVEDKADLDLKVGEFSNLCIFAAVMDFLCLQMPAPTKVNFSVADVRAAVGSRRLVDVVDCDTKKMTTMTLKDWHR